MRVRAASSRAAPVAVMAGNSQALPGILACQGPGRRRRQSLTIAAQQPDHPITPTPQAPATPYLRPKTPSPPQAAPPPQTQAVLDDPRVPPGRLVHAGQRLL